MADDDADRGRSVGDAEQVIVVGDRENDIYSVMARRPAGTELIVRAARDRVLEDGASCLRRPPSGGC